MESITGALLSAFLACPRQGWLFAHEVNADQDNEFLDLGRQLHEQSYQRERKELAMPGMKIDVLRTSRESGANGANVVVCEVKKSDRFLRSAVMQLCFYLWRMKQQGVIAKGEIRIPRMKKRFEVELTDAKENELLRIMANIEQLVAEPKPPAPVKGKFCRKCAYETYCFA